MTSAMTDGCRIFDKPQPRIRVKMMMMPAWMMKRRRGSVFCQTVGSAPEMIEVSWAARMEMRWSVDAMVETRVVKREKEVNGQPGDRGAPPYEAPESRRWNNEK